jgi:hypothetical protein
VPEGAEMSRSLLQATATRYDAFAAASSDEKRSPRWPDRHG